MEIFVYFFLATFRFFRSVIKFGSTLCKRHSVYRIYGSQKGFDDLDIIQQIHININYQCSLSLSVPLNAHTTHNVNGERRRTVMKNDIALFCSFFFLSFFILHSFFRILYLKLGNKCMFLTHKWIEMNVCGVRRIQKYTPFHSPQHIKISLLLLLLLSSHSVLCRTGVIFSFRCKMCKRRIHTGNLAINDAI